MNTIQDATSRQKALDPHLSFIVQAPAGSGKTELLTQRYLILLSLADKAPEEIIAITFTRKSAAEMRARVIQALVLGEKPEPDKNDYRHVTWSLAQAVIKKDQLLQWHLIRNPNRLRILTIDALAAFICRQTPMLTQLGATPVVCENAVPFYQLASQRLITHLVSDTQYQPLIEHVLLHMDNHVGKCEALFVDLLMKRDQWLPHIMYGYTNQASLRNILEKNLARSVIEKMQEAVLNFPHHLRQTLVQLAQHIGIAVTADDVISNKNTCLTRYPIWLAFSNMLLTQQGEWRKTVTIKNGFGPQDPHKSLMLAALTECFAFDDFKNALRDIQLLPPTRYAESQWKTLDALIQVLPLLCAQLSLIFAEKKQIDFIELNFSALKALGNDESPTDLALYLDYHIQHLLIDEFQDTSVMHFQLIEKMIAGWQPNDGRTLFLVGDPMQSIYRFRNAEVGLFLRAQQQGIGSVTLESLTLSMNFRSQANLVHWFNHTFQTVFPATSDMATGKIPYTHAIAARSAIPECDAHFYPVINDQSGDEASVVVKKITEIQRQYPTDSIAILVRARSQLISLIPLLQQETLPYQAIDIEPLAQRDEIRDLLSLTRALHHRADRLSWLSVLRAPWCGLTLDDLEKITVAADKSTLWEIILHHDLSQLSEDGVRRLLRIRTCFQHAFQTQTHLSLSAWIEGIWIMLGGPAVLKNAVELEYVNAYFELLTTLDNLSADRSMESLTEQCDKRYASAKNTAGNAIQILTIHKSKGLEFDHVFLLSLHQKKQSDHEKLFRWLEKINAAGQSDLLLAPMKSITDESDLIYDYLKKIEAEKQDYEMSRLLYVAATRAKKSLHCFATVQWDEKNAVCAKPPRGSFLDKLWPLYQDTLPTRYANPLPEKQRDQKNPIQLSRLSSDFNHPDIAPIHLFEPVYIDIALSSSIARLVGTVIHDILQAIAEKNNVAWIETLTFPTQQWQSRLFSVGVLDCDIPNAIDTITKAITTTLTDSRGQWILNQTHHAKCEWPLTYVNEEGCQHLIVDRSFVDDAGIRWIIDYKTSQPLENETLSVFLERQKKEYREKMQLYADVLAQMESRPIQMGLYFPLCGGWIAWAASIGLSQLELVGQ